MVEYIAGSSDLPQNEGLLISHSVVTSCGVSQHLWSIKPTQASEKETFITHIPPFFVICSNSNTRILDRYSSSCCSMTLTVVRGIWYDISRIEQELYPVWRFAWLGILHKGCACTIYQPHSIGGLWVEQQQWRLLLSSLSKHIILLSIHDPVKDCYWSNHPTTLSDHGAGIQLGRKLTYSLY